MIRVMALLSMFFVSVVARADYDSLLQTQLDQREATLLPTVVVFNDISSAWPLFESKWQELYDVMTLWDGGPYPLFWDETSHFLFKHSIKDVRIGDPPTYMTSYKKKKNDADSELSGIDFLGTQIQDAINQAGDLTEQEYFLHLTTIQTVIDPAITTFENLVASLPSKTQLEGSHAADNQPAWDDYLVDQGGGYYGGP